MAPYFLHSFSLVCGLQSNFLLIGYRILNVSFRNKGGTKKNLRQREKTIRATESGRYFIYELLAIRSDFDGSEKLSDIKKPLVVLWRLYYKTWKKCWWWSIFKML